MEKRPDLMITRLEVQNYRSLANVVLDFSPLTVLVGQNSRGKSNIVDVLRFVADAMNLGLDEAIRRRDGIRALRRWSSKGRLHNVVIRLEMEASGWRGTFVLELGSRRGGEYFIKREACSVKGETFRLYEIQEGKLVISPFGTEEVPYQTFPLTSLYLPHALQPEFLKVGAALRDIGVYNIIPRNIRTSVKPTFSHFLLGDGSNLSSVLQHLRKEKHPNWDKIKEAIGYITPGITDISISAKGEHLIARLHRGKDRSSFPLAMESDGTLRALGLLTALYQDPPRTLVAIEEPELNIYPGSLAALCGIFLRVSQTTQIVLTTHSPDLLERVPTESLRII